MAALVQRAQLGIHHIHRAQLPGLPSGTQGTEQADLHWQNSEFTITNEIKKATAGLSSQFLSSTSSLLCSDQWNR